MGVQQRRLSALWAGYVAGVASDGSPAGSFATPGPYTVVTGTWTVPTLPTSGAFANLAVWVGIGGEGDAADNLIQCGVDVIRSGRTADVVYVAPWLEVIDPGAPLRQLYVPVAVSMGDQLRMTLSQSFDLGGGDGIWQMLLENLSSGESFTHKLLASYSGLNDTVQSSRACAEWIVEVPNATISEGGVVVPLPDFTGSIDFTDCRATSGGTSHPLNDFPLWKITYFSDFGTLGASNIGIDDLSFSVAPINPTVDSVSPASGPRAGGTTVTITGDGFNPSLAEVTFGSTPARITSVSNPQTIVCTSPAGTGTVDVHVTQGTSVSPTVAGDVFHYV